MKQGLGLSLANVTVVSDLDSDAALFISTAGITNVIQKTAINNLFLGLKSTGIWTLTDSFKPIVGGTTGTHRVDGKTPGTQNATFLGSPTHNSSGVTLNGSSSWFRSGYTNTSLLINNFTKLIYIINDTSISNFICPLSTVSTSAGTSVSYIERLLAGADINWYVYNGANLTYSRALSPFIGLVGYGRKNPSLGGLYIDSTLTEAASAQSEVIPANQTACGCYNNGSAEFFKGTVQFQWEGKYLNSTNYTALISLITDFNTALSR